MIGACLSVLLCCGLFAQGLAGQSESGFSTVLWLHGGPPRNDDFFATVKSLGFSAVSVSGGEDPALPGKHGLRYYHDQIMGKGVLELRQQQWEASLHAYEKSRHRDALQRPACLSSAETMTDMVRLLAERLEQTLSHQPIAVSLADEMSVTRHANPLDFCFAPPSLRSFRQFVAAKYGDIASLNLAWETEFDSYEQLHPYTTDEMRERAGLLRGLPHNLRPWADHRAFMDAELAKLVRILLQQIRRHSDDLPCGLTGVQPPSAFGGHDYQRLLPHLDFYEVYDIGGARDLVV